MTTARFSQSRLAATLDEACRQAGLDPDGAELIHVTANALYRLATTPIIVRIAGTSRALPRVRRLVELTSWLERRDFPTVQLASELPQPLTIEATDHVVTFWRYLPQNGEELPASALAEPLRQLHALPRPPFELPAWNPIADAHRRLDNADGVDDADRAWLLDRCDEIADQLAQLHYMLPTCVIHADAYTGNLLIDQSRGRAVLCDLDGVCIGPPEWDLLPEWLSVLRFGYPAEEYDRFAVAYGFDIRAWDGWPVLRNVRELNVLTGATPVLTSSPAIAAEFRHRMAGLRHGDTTARWTPYSATAQPRA